MPENEQIKADEIKGAFFESLIRTAPKIRRDRALSIQESAQMVYKRQIEDTEIEIKQLKRDRENMLDMSPDNITSLKVASDFNGREFVDKDVEIGIRLRNLEIKLEISKNRYVHLFGGNE